MRYTTRVQKKNDSTLKFADILDATKKLSPDPIEKIEVSYDMYEDLLASAKDMFIPRRKFSEKIYLGSLFGVKIVIDPELKPGEYKIVSTPSD